MSRTRKTAVAVAALAAVATAGCGFGPGESAEGEARLTVTRDYGATPVLEATVADPTESDTVIRVLDREAEITTRFAGDFVHSIEGVEGTIEAGRSRDWFFYVNGLWSSRGAAAVDVEPGDRIWWDYRDWTDAMQVSAVVGSWPQPFAGAGDPVRVECAVPGPACDAVAERLAETGVEAEVGPAGGASGDAPRVLVGPWPRLAADPVAGLLDDDPSSSGVFARFERDGGGLRLETLDERGQEVGRPRRAGLVAALREGEQPPTWVVSGTDRRGVESAAALFGAGALENRYALAVVGESPIGLPVAERALAGDDG